MRECRYPVRPDSQKLFDLGQARDTCAVATKQVNGLVRTAAYEDSARWFEYLR